MVLGHWTTGQRTSNSASAIPWSGSSHSQQSDGLDGAAMLIYSMGVSVDGYIIDREAGFGWTPPDEELFRFHLAQLGFEAKPAPAPTAWLRVAQSLPGPPCPRL